MPGHAVSPSTSRQLAGTRSARWRSIVGVAVSLTVVAAVTASARPASASANGRLAGRAHLDRNQTAAGGEPATSSGSSPSTETDEPPLPGGIVEVSHERDARGRASVDLAEGSAPGSGTTGLDVRGAVGEDTGASDDAESELPAADEGEVDFADDEGEVDFGASGEDSYDPLRDSPEALKARHWMIAGIVGTTVGTILGAGAIATVAADPCLTGGGNNCFEDARNRAGAIMGVPAAAMVLGGVGMIGYGAVQRRKLRASVASDGVTTLFTVQGRF